MKNSESPQSVASYVGHIKNGVVVLDTAIPLRDGQAVRVEPLGDRAQSPLEADRANRLHRLQQLFTQWTEEDAQLPGEQADLLQHALEQNQGMRFRSPTLD